MKDTMKTVLQAAAILALTASTATAAGVDKQRGPVTASVGTIPARYVKPGKAWSATVSVDRTRITVSVDMPEHKRGHHIESAAHFDGDTLVLDKALPAFAGLALQGNEDEHVGGHSTLTRSVSVVPLTRMTRLTTRVIVPSSVRWVSYRTRKEWLRDHPQIMDANPATRWNGYDATMAARRTATLIAVDVDDFRARAKAKEDAEQAAEAAQPAAQTPDPEATFAANKASWYASCTPGSTARVQHGAIVEVWTCG